MIFLNLDFHFRFLKSCIPSIVVTYWNPASMSFVASLAVAQAVAEAIPF
jgi:hypothetical protein